MRLLDVNNRLIDAALSADHSASSYGRPVLLIVYPGGEQPQAFGPLDCALAGLAIVEASEKEREDLWTGGYYLTIAGRLRWRPNYTIGGVPVMLVEEDADGAGPAYTEDEWRTGENADFERQPDGSWTFQRRPVEGEVLRIEAAASKRA